MSTSHQLLTISEADPAKVYIPRWEPTGSGYAEVWRPAEGLDPESAEIIHTSITFGKVRSLFIECGECGLAGVSIRLFPGTATACPKCFTIYRLELV